MNTQTKKKQKGIEHNNAIQHKKIRSTCEKMAKQITSNVQGGKKVKQSKSKVQVEKGKTK